MKSSKKFIWLIIPFMISAFAEAQTVKVQKGTARVKSVPQEGVQIQLDGTAPVVSAAFNKYLKTIGKTKVSGDLITVTESVMGGTVNSLPVFGITWEKGGHAFAWLGIEKAEWSEAEVKKINTELEKVLYDFGVKYYQDRIQVQIDESERASVAVVKQQQKLASQNKDLNVKLENNKKEKLQIEKALEANKLAYTALLAKIEKNKHDQDSVALAGVQIKKATDMNREKQKKVK